MKTSHIFGSSCQTWTFDPDAVKIWPKNSSISLQAIWQANVAMEAMAILVFDMLFA